jgi:hypothetical protein
MIRKRRRKARGENMLQYILQIQIEAGCYELRQSILVSVGLGTIGYKHSVSPGHMKAYKNDKC